LGFNALEFYDLDNEEKNDFLIMPIEIGFVPLNIRNMFYLSVYSKLGLGLTQYNDNNQINSYFYGAIGTKFYLFSELIFRYSPHLSVFVEYNTRNELRICFGIDLSAIIYFAIIGYKERKEREYDTTFDWTK
jgi:hypothetical protein